MATCVDQEGYKKAEEIRADAMKNVTIAKNVFAGFAMLQAVADAVSAYKRLHDVSDETLRIEEAEFAFNKKVYWKAEDMFFDEFFTAEPWENAETLARRYEGRLWPPIAAQFAKKISALRCNKPRYCANAYIRAMQEIEVTMAATRTSVQTLAGQLAFAEVEGIAERNFDRRKSAYGLYKGLVAQAAGYYASAGQGFSEVGASAARDAISGINTLMYQNGRAGQEAGREEFHARTAARAGSDGGGQGGLGGAQSRSAQLASEGEFRGSGASDAAAFKGATSGDTNGQQQATLGPGNFNNTMAAGTGANLVRSGKITLTHPGDTYNVQGGEGGVVTIPTWSVTIDVDKLPLADASSYDANLELTGPHELPGTSDGDVKYQKPNGA